MATRPATETLGWPGLAGTPVLVAGAGVSGRSAAEALLAAGARVTVTDAAEERLAALASLQAEGAELVVGLTEPPAGTGLVVTSPGWRPDTPLLAAAAAAGVEVVGEVELAWRLDRARAAAADAGEGPATWLAVTGTNGKTTTVGMLESILRAAGLDAVACGNVGLPVVDAVRAGHRVLAVELSSFQLHWSPSLRPAAGAVLNVAEDHLDWHGSMAAYAGAKARALVGDVAVAGVDDANAAALLAAAPASRRVGVTLAEPAAGQLGLVGDALVDRAFADGEPLAEIADVRPGGPPGLTDALVAAALARAHGVPASAVRAGLRAYRPAAHRAELVAEAGNVRYVDDSKATNPHAAAASLHAHDRVVWVAGGQLKGASVDELVAGAASRLAGAVLLGVDRDRIAAALARHAPEVPVREVTTGDDGAMREAVRAARSLARPGDVVLLAPAAASLDMFTDYAHRGRAFAEAVRAVIAETADPSGPGR
ncbi:UDP-N-acetylmuramoyl-L-alanine--D-glutamate ligase [Streptoalloteichus hindustanus]|uniref:UDP-N-acetylmuramoylalanine--D-glutamate ligase n=1 Tax=Streptoalloteichus hindustanus TaxID=2017 RepID=A0A1M5AV59_STRHI|nr:UDP-N-acetylmuramoyl-L-alanine--D-glutamate ligase [Streptoalloteichus hindustanus]SHF33822.1 UDP-N-acetylmuramoylalanine--D-glutamate ligase [Streptoalloteichus hindustanus]